MALAHPPRLRTGSVVGARDVTTRELVRLVHERRTILVDARPAPEYAEGHLPGAVSLPIDEQDEARVRALLGPDLSRPVVTYCWDYG